MSENPDRAALRRAARKVGLRIALVCAAMVIAVIIAAAIYMLRQAQHPVAVAEGGPRVFVDSNDILQAMVLAGLAGIVLAGAAGWLSARSAIQPLADALALQRRFVQDASHELRTPLTILDARVQLAQRQAEAGSDLAGILGQVRADAAGLTGTVEELLLAATSGSRRAGSELVDVAEIAGVAVADLQQTARERGIVLEFQGEAGPRVRIAGSSLRRAVLALLDNALTHTPSGGTVSVAVCARSARAVIAVSDSGPGISGVSRDRVFERFARQDEPTAGRRSYGIGLALVREIAVQAGGSVEVSSTGTTGTTMTLVLPVASP